MHNFTKEELKDITSWLSEIHHDSFDDVGRMINKLQNMIDNYGTCPCCSCAYIRQMEVVQ